MDCGTWENLQVDHVDARTKITHRVWFWSAKRREAELAKCVVRCDPCHRVKTALNHEKATQKPGELNTFAKLTRQEADEIRASNLTDSELTQIYPVHRTTVNRIRRGVIRVSEIGAPGEDRTPDDAG